MGIRTPQEFDAVLALFDEKAEIFEINDVAAALRSAVSDYKSLDNDTKKGHWAETAAFAFALRDGKSPWLTHFFPSMSGTNGDGSPFYIPDLSHADFETLEYWSVRANTVKHPVLVARYADLVWDTTGFITKKKRRRTDFEHGILAVDAYLAAAKIDDGSAWTDTHRNLRRALTIALSIKDSARIGQTSEVMLDYVDRTSDENHIGTYAYLMESLLPSKGGPVLSKAQEESIVGLFESRFKLMTTAGGKWDVDPHAPRAIGVLLANYYSRKNLIGDQRRVLSAIAKAFERRASIGDASTGLLFLEHARDYFVEAALPEEAERIQRLSQELGPKAEQSLIRSTISQEIPKAELEAYLAAVMEGTISDALFRFTRYLIPSQDELKKQIEQLKQTHPLYSMFANSPVVLGDGHIKANIGDDTDDPDGRMVYETAQRVRFQSFWIAQTIDRLVAEGLTSTTLIEFIRPCLLFAEDRLPFIQRGLDAHFMGDYVQSIHLLIPQLERALVSLLYQSGRASNKQHRTGRGVMQSKNLNNVLNSEGWPLTDKRAEDLRMYLLSTLAHPKGLNFRNEVCHGLWSAQHFVRPVSDILLHLLLSVSLLRPVPTGTASAGPSQENSVAT